MWMFLIGIALLAFKVAEVGPVAAWSWWWVLAPFAATALWWEFADRFGITRRRADSRTEERKGDRRRRAIERLGLGRRPDR